MLSKSVGVALSGSLLAGSMLLVTPAHAVTQHCPAGAGAVKVEDDMSPATITVTDSRTGKPIDVVVTITGTTFTVKSADPALELVDASPDHDGAHPVPGGRRRACPE